MNLWKDYDFGVILRFMACLYHFLCFPRLFIMNQFADLGNKINYKIFSCFITHKHLGRIACHEGFITTTFDGKDMPLLHSHTDQVLLLPWFIPFLTKPNSDRNSLYLQPNMISSSIGTNINLLDNGRFVAPTPAFAWSEPHKSKG